jgi:long-chain acyl-CoA synthetase
MHIFHHAASQPDTAAVIIAETGQQISFAELEARSNQIAHLFRAHGVQRGDAIAMLLDNCLDYFSIVWAAQRSGLYFTCISTKLTTPEVDYIVRNCGAKIFIASSLFSTIAESVRALLPEETICYSVNGSINGFSEFEPIVVVQRNERIADESLGRSMLYSSGTTGYPKGVKSTLTGGKIDEPDTLTALTKFMFNFGPGIRYLSPAPLYHAAPLGFSIATLKWGGTVIVMQQFDPEAALRFIETYKITHSQWVPTMFVRMLKLPHDIHHKYDLSSHEVAIHAAAPCPIEVKKQMIDWWGPKIFEYYAATEGAGFTAITPQEWLTKPGSVGKALLGTIRIVDEIGELVPTGEIGRIFFEGGPSFEYHNDAEKTRESINDKGWATFGDIGYVDADGYLFLTDRKAFMIISGGVNVYPQETENILIMHPRIADVAVFGVPHDELGEAVKAVVQPQNWEEATPEFAEELMAFCRERLSAIKTPKSIDFEKELPRHATGKLYKRLLRDRYWPK